MFTNENTACCLKDCHGCKPDTKVNLDKVVSRISKLDLLITDQFSTLARLVDARQKELTLLNDMVTINGEKGGLVKNWERGTDLILELNCIITSMKRRGVI